LEGETIVGKMRAMEKENEAKAEQFEEAKQKSVAGYKQQMEQINEAHGSLLKSTTVAR
jgi:predicted transcriptional regulator